MSSNLLFSVLSWPFPPTVTVPSTMAQTASTCFLLSSGDSGLQTWGLSSFPGGLLLPRGEGRGFLDTQPLWVPSHLPTFVPSSFRVPSCPILRSGRVWGCQSSPLGRVVSVGAAQGRGLGRGLGGRLGARLRDVLAHSPQSCHVEPHTAPSHPPRGTSMGFWVQGGFTWKSSP